MPGHVAHEEVPVRRTLVIRPIQANLTIDDNLISKMDAYCKFKCGHHKAKTEVCKDAGKWPFWNTVLKLSTRDELYAECQIKNKKLGGLYGKTIATCKIPLREAGQTIGTEGHMTEWFNVNQNMKPVGRILLDISYETMDEVPLKNTVVDPNIKEKPQSIGPNSKSITQNPNFNEIYNLSQNPPPLSRDPRLNEISKVNQYPSDVYQNANHNLSQMTNLNQHSNLNQISSLNPSLNQVSGLTQSPNLNQTGLGQNTHIGQVPTVNQATHLNQISNLNQHANMSQIPVLNQNPILPQVSGLSQNHNVNQVSGLSQHVPINQVSTIIQNPHLN